MWSRQRNPKHKPKYSHLTFAILFLGFKTNSSLKKFIQKIRLGRRVNLAVTHEIAVVLRPSARLNAGWSNDRKMQSDCLIKNFGACMLEVRLLRPQEKKNSTYPSSHPKNQAHYKVGKKNCHNRDCVAGCGSFASSSWRYSKRKSRVVLLLLFPTIRWTTPPAVPTSLSSTSFHQPHYWTLVLDRHWSSRKYDRDSVTWGA